MPEIRIGQGSRPSLRSTGTRSGGSDARPTMVLEFSTFNHWYEIEDRQGRYLERTVPGAFRKTLASGGKNLKILFNHGSDSTMGRMVLGMPAVAEERANSPYVEVPLFDGVPPLILSGLREGAYGSSFMFEVVSESWNQNARVSDHNPDGLPERTITEASVIECGPVTWPANPAATAGMRSQGTRSAEAMRRRLLIRRAERLVGGAA